VNWPLERKPWPHQCEAHAACYPRSASMVAGGLGVGKSLISYSLLAAWDCRKVLILCPASVRSVHRRELAKHYPAMGAIILENGSVAKRTECAARAVSMSPGPLAIVANYEACSLSPLADWILSQNWDAVILDESHLGGVKTDDTQTSRFVAQLTDISERRACLTGTPLAQHPLNAYGQYRFLDRNVFCRDYPTYRDFARHFAAPKQLKLRKRIKSSHAALAASVAACFGASSPLLDELGEPPDMADALPGINHAAEFEQRISPLTWRCRSADVLDLPPMMHDTREVELSPEQQRAYGQIWSQLQAELADGSCSTINSPLTLGIRWQQISSGFIGCDDGTIYRFPQNPKREALRDLLREAGEKAVVFCRFVADLDTVSEVCRELGLRYGELSHRRKDCVTDLATMRPDIDVAGVQPQSGGVGIDLSSAKIGVWYSLSRSLPEYDQAIGRLHRPGTTGCRFYSLIGKDTVDETIANAIEDRREIVEAIMSHVTQRSLCP
jgi:SNF2 family DNA or RNA helicase